MEVALLGWLLGWCCAQRIAQERTLWVQRLGHSTSFDWWCCASWGAVLGGGVYWWCSATRGAALGTKHQLQLVVLAKPTPVGGFVPGCAGRHVRR
jgi:hypothetical protein